MRPKKLTPTLLTIFLAACVNHVMAQTDGVLIDFNANAPQRDNSAVLELRSSTQGMLAPRLTMVQRDDIASPANGLLIYQTDNTSGFYYFNGTAWVWMPGTGTVTSIATGTGLTGGVISSTGTISMADMPANTIKGNASNGTAAPTDIEIPANTVLGRRGASTDIVAARVITNQIQNSNVTNAKLANMDQALIKGRAAAAGTGDPQDLTAAEVRTILNVADGATANAGTVTSIATGPGLTGGPITESGTVSMANMAALSVKGNATNAVAAPTDIVAGADHRVLRRSGTAIGFGAINLASTNAVTGTLPVANLPNLAGDVTGPITSNTVVKLQGRDVTTTAPTSGQVLKWNGSAWAPAADNNDNTTYTAGTGISLTGTTFANTGVLSWSAGTTGLTPNTATTGAVTLAGTLNVANGGTGRNTLTANNLIVGNGTTAVNFIAPGTSGNVLVSNGTAWTSSNGTGQFIRNQNTAVQTANFWISGTGTMRGTLSVGGGSTNNTYTSAGAIALKQSDSNPFISFHGNTGDRQGYIQSSVGTNTLTIASELPSGMRLITGGLERVRIQNDGQVLIGTATASTLNNPKLVVNGNIAMTSGAIHTISGQGRVRIAAFGDGASDDIVLMTGQTNTNRLMIKRDGKIGIGDDYSSPPNRLSVRDGLTDYVMRVENTQQSPAGAHVFDCVGGGTSGDFFIAFRRTSNSAIIGSISRNGGSNVAFNTSSDIRLKENIKESVNGLSIINKLRVVDYNYFEDNRTIRVTGYIAQEAYEVIPSVVHKGGDDVKENPWGIDYGKLTPYLTKAIQEQQAMIEELKQDNTQLRYAVQNKVEANDLEKLKAEIQYLKDALLKAEK